MTLELLGHEALAMSLLPASVMDATDIGTHAVEYALNNWAVFPLNGKVPAIAGGRGVLDATTDLATVLGWWGGPYAGCNIGARIPGAMLMIDVDPRNGGLESWAALEEKHGRFPDCLMTLSGREDSGSHRYVRRPPGKLSAKQLGPGIDLKTPSGYAVMPPSVHPDTGKPYVRVDRPVPAPPDWFTTLVVQPERTPAAAPSPHRTRFSFSGPSIADKFTASTSWSDILGPHGWRCLDADPDGDGARWLHPTHTSACSATVKNGCLFVYSTNTPFDITESGNPRGYTRFKAHAVLNHAGDMSAAARSLKEVSR